MIDNTPTQITVRKDILNDIDNIYNELFPNSMPVDTEYKIQMILEKMEKLIAIYEIISEVKCKK